VEFNPAEDIVPEFKVTAEIKLIEIMLKNNIITK
jgi:hypothetical protein